MTMFTARLLISAARHILQCISEALVYFTHPTKSINVLDLSLNSLSHPVQSQTKYFKDQTGPGHCTAFLFYYKKQNLYIYISCQIFFKSFPLRPFSGSSSET